MAYNSAEDIITLCQLQDWCLPGQYPFVFPDKYRSGRVSGSPLLQEMTASSSSSSLLKKLNRSLEEVKLPKSVLLKDEESGQVSFLPSHMLTPSSEFIFRETEDCFIVGKADGNPVDETEESVAVADITGSSEVLYDHNMLTDAYSTSNLVDPPSCMQNMNCSCLNEEHPRHAHEELDMEEAVLNRLS